MNKFHVIFLDIDGVLNSDASFEKNVLIDHEKILLLDRIICSVPKKTKIVISSTWRYSQSCENFSFWLQRLGCWNFVGMYKTSCNMFNDKKYDHIRRGMEVEEWVNEHISEIYSYIIIDDDSDFLDYQKKYLIQTKNEIGLTETNVIDAINCLRKRLTL